MKKLFCFLVLVSSFAFAQGTLPNMGLHTWARGTNPGAGSLTANSDSLNGNWFKVDSLWGVGHKNGDHFNPSVIGIVRFLDDSTIKIQWRNDDTIITKSTGQYALITQVRDNGTRTAAALIGMLVRTSDDDSTLSGITAYANGVTQLFGSVQVLDSLSFEHAGVGKMKFLNQANSDYFALINYQADTTLVFRSHADTLFTLFGGAVNRRMTVDAQTALQFAVRTEPTGLTNVFWLKDGTGVDTLYFRQKDGTNKQVAP